MKTLKLTLLALIISSIAYSQTDSTYIIREVDYMSDEVYFYANRGIVVANQEQTMGFGVHAYFGKKLEFKMITANMVGIGNCNENDKMIILFENGEKIILKSWNGFNCDGDAYFYVKNMDLLKTQPLSKIRMTNGYTYDSYTGDVQDKDKNYFIKLFSDIENNKYININ